jgi:stage IV sporulation protein B
VCVGCDKKILGNFHFSLRRNPDTGSKSHIGANIEIQKGKRRVAALFIIIISFFAINIKNTEKAVTVNANIKLIPVGQAVGMKLKTNGVLVVGIKKDLPAKDAGIKNGDVIKKVNGVEILNTNHFEEIIKAADSLPLTLEIERKRNILKATVTPQKNEADQVVCGMWLRDSAIGIGTITFVTEDKKNFGALGHPINDCDTENIYSIRKGSIESAEIKDVKTGEKNKPGELVGFLANGKIGEILENNNFGLYGKIDDIDYISDEPVNILPKSKVKLGKAEIISTVSGNKRKKFEIEIVKVSENSENKDFIIKVTDHTLIAETGGIVQGMSGSPIMQDGFLIGAVTHVMVNDPKKGFGISIEKMAGVIN